MPTPIATFYAQESPQGTAAITTSSITVTNGQILVVKLSTWDTATAMGAPTGGSQTYTSRVINNPGGFNQWCGIYTCAISGSPGTLTVSSTPAASARCSMLVEQWPAGSLAASPVTASSSGVGAPVAGTFTPSAGTSAISWVGGDAGSADPAGRTYVNSGTDEGVRDDHVGANGVDYYGYQQATGTSGQSYGLTLPASTTYVIAGIEILDTSGATPIVDPTWAPHRLVPPGRISPAGFWVPWSGDLTISITNASATEAAGTGTALDAVVALGANATEAAGTGAAQDAVSSPAANAAEATASGAAQDAVAALGANAAEATGAGVANDATVSTSGSTNASAAEATGSGSAPDAQAAIGANAAEATGSGVAQSAQASITSNAAEAVASGVAADAAAAVGVGATEAAGSGSALDATASPAAQPTEAAGTGVAYDASITLTTFAGVAAAAGVAYDATVTLGAPGSAFAGVATGVGTAYDARARKLIPRPNTGTTARPYSGITQRP